MRCLQPDLWLWIRQTVPSPGAVAVAGGGVETPVACCVLPGCACEPPAGLCADAAAWPQPEGQPRPGGERSPRTPRGFQQGLLAGHAAPSAVHTPSAGSWGARLE